MINWRRDISGFRLFLTSTVTLCIQEGENVEEIICFLYARTFEFKFRDVLGSHKQVFYNNFFSTRERQAVFFLEPDFFGNATLQFK